jgi:hypothetical protein
LQSLGIWLNQLWSREALYTIPECFKDDPHFIYGSASHSMAQVRSFAVSPLFFIVQVNGSVVSWHLVKVNLVQGGPIHNL